MDFSGARILVIGDLFLDRFVYGDVVRISPEAPVPVLRETRRTSALGGAGNVAANAASLGAKVSLIGAAGTERAGREVCAIAARFGIDTSAMFRPDDHDTTVKTRYIAGHQQVLRVDEEVQWRLDGAEVEARAAAAMKECDAVILSDYGKGVLNGWVPRKIINAARGVNIPVIADVRAADFQRFAHATYVTPNSRELSLSAGRRVVGDADVVETCRTLAARHSLKGVIATRSEQGMSVVTEAAAEHIRTTARQVFDVSGAGDTVVAVLACALVSGTGVVDAARLANRAAGIVVGKVGTAVVTPDELWPCAVERSDIAEKAARWREQGLRVGLANGCFDILHKGHVATLEFASDQCDRLIVGLNSDASVKRLKGDGRPVNSQNDRARVLLALGCVDDVVIFDEDTPADLISAVRPDVLIKGGDYEGEPIVGAESAGEVRIAPYVDGCSSTALIECSATT